ncbi:unnamed protein product, partial [Mesorhabditis spiculigera]
MTSIMREHPQYKFALADPDIFAVDSTPIHPIFGVSLELATALLIAAMVIEVIPVGAMCLAHSFWLLSGGTLFSPNTRRLQMKLMYGLLVQMAVPLVTIAIPWGFFAVVIILDWAVSPATLNFWFWLDAAHATISSITMALYTDPYRKYIWHLVWYRRSVLVLKA